MTISKNIVYNKRPTTAKEVMLFFRDDKRIIGKSLIAFEVQYDSYATHSDLSYRSVYDSHYIVIAEFK